MASGHIRSRQLRTKTAKGKPQRRFDVVVYVGKDEAGKKRYKWRRGFKLKGDAERALRELLNQVDAGTLTPGRRVTVAEFAERWLQMLQLRPSTVSSYDFSLRKYLLPNLGTQQLGDVTTESLTRLYARLPLAPKTVLNLHGVIRRMLADAVAWGYVGNNVAEGVKLPKRKKPNLEAWSPDQLRTFIAHVQDDWLYAAWLLFVTTGLRRGEVAGLRWQDLDLAAGTLRVRKPRVVVRFKVHTGDPKTDAGSRTVALDDATVEALRAHPRTGALVFSWPDGRELHPELLSKWFRWHARDAGLPPIRLHDLRASYITAAIEANIPLQVLAARVGHADTSITLNVYARVLKDADRRAASEVARFILGA